MAVTLQIQFNGKYLIIPINPEELNLQRTADNKNLDIVGIGPVTKKGPPNLYKLDIESFFPGTNSYFYTGVKPSTCVEFIDDIWKTENLNNNVAKITSTGLPKNFNFYFVIDNFSWIYKAGEDDDIYYKLSIKEYIPYGVQLIDTNLIATNYSTSEKIRTTSSAVDTSNKLTYTVQKGDCLWNIAKAASGNGANWQELYNLNKSIIGTNPNLIKPGQVLTLPSGWKGDVKTQKLASTSNINKTTVNNSGNKNSTSSNTKVITKIAQGPAKPTTTNPTYTREIAPSAVSLLAQQGKIVLNTNKSKNSN